MLYYYVTDVTVTVILELRNRDGKGENKSEKNQ